MSDKKMKKKLILETLNHYINVYRYFNDFTIIIKLSNFWETIKTRSLTTLNEHLTNIKNYLSNPRIYLFNNFILDL